MKIQNVKIKNVTIGNNDRDKLAVTMSFDGLSGGCAWAFIMENPVDVQRLKLLMKYAEVSEVVKLEGKIVRVFIHDSFIRGFGDPIKDKFVPLTSAEAKEVTETEFVDLMKQIW